MFSWIKKILKSLFLPGGVVFLGTLLLGYSGWLTFPPAALTFLSYCSLIGGMFLAWRFHSSRVFFCLCVLLLAHEALAGNAGQHTIGPSGLMALHAVSFLVPLNYALICLMEERGLTISSAAPVAVFLFIECVVVSVLCRSAETGPLASHLRHSVATLTLPKYTIFVFGSAGLALLIRFLFTRKTVDNSLFWSLLAFLFVLRGVGSAARSELFLASSACILSFSIVENSYLLAYHDELTSLPSRRAFNDASLRLQEPYSAAVVDIDHFKRFNDTYGHDTGDDVLRLVASKLAGVTGGGHAYRCGGEEFTILFPGKKLADVTAHLERLRSIIETSEFRMRGGDRRQLTRGSDRRTQAKPGAKKRKADAIRELSQPATGSSLSVTVSIGVASSESEGPNPEAVIQAADRALYRAKENGRNRLEVAIPKRGSKAKSAGIA